MNAETTTLSGLFSGKNLLWIIIAGIAGEIIFELIAWLLMPQLIGRPMQPALLVMGLAKKLLDIGLTKPAAFSIHLAVGAILFPICYVLFLAVTKIQSWLVAGISWGVVLWFIAQGILAPLMGRPFMLGFVPYTWAALGAHIALIVTIAFVYQRLSPRSAEVRPS
ncbi:MAG: hypothetical protein ACE5GZ_05355 [Gammaproteobacteria bacterium]